MTNGAAYRKLTPRLASIRDEIAKNGFVDRIYEIGTDHAYLPISLIQSGVCGAVDAADISAKSLERAKANVHGSGLSDRIAFYAGDGFRAFTNYEPGKTVVIAGIGGVKIAEIVCEGYERANDASLLALQPMNSQEALREKLIGMGFEIKYETLAIEGRRVYSLLFCGRARQNIVYAPEELYIGKKVIYKAIGEYLGFLRFTRIKVLNRHNGLKSAIGGLGDFSDELRKLEAVLHAIDDRIDRYQGE